LAGERDLEKNDTKLREFILQAQLGSPEEPPPDEKLQEQGNKQLVQKMELDHIADRRCRRTSRCTATSKTICSFADERVLGT
jgi:hypothetical protein